jgi:hypothetical protein
MILPCMRGAERKIGRGGYRNKGVRGERKMYVVEEEMGIGMKRERKSSRI